jgi:hypothetical protein
MPVIRQQRQIFNKPIGVQSFNTGAEQVGQAVSNFANNVGQIVYEEAAQQAQEGGIERAKSAVLFDAETGRPSMPQSPEGMGPIARRAYEQVIDRRFVDALDKDVRIKSQEIASKYKDPVQYENMFSNYLTSLSKGADPKFSNVVMESGKYVMASTKISLADAARARARAAAADSLVANNEEAREAIFDLASAGNLEEAKKTIEERSTATTEGVQSELLKKGADRAVTSDLAATAITGVMQKILQTATQVETAALSVYISSQGAIGGDLISEDQKESLSGFIGYVDRSNTKTILANTDAIASDYNNIRAAEASKQQAIIEAQALDFELNLGDYVHGKEYYATIKMQEAMQSPDLSVIRGGIQVISDQTLVSLSNLSKQRRAGIIKSSTEREEIAQDYRRAGLKPVIYAIAAGGNIASLKAALNTGSPEDLNMLSAAQQEGVIALRKSEMYDDDLDRDYVQKLLTGTKNEVRNRIELEQFRADLYSQASASTSDVLDGNYSAEQVGNTFNSIEDALSKGKITGEQRNSLYFSLQSAVGRGMANLASKSMTSSDLLALTNYVKTNGNKTETASPYVVSVGQGIISVVPESKLNEVSQHINSIRETTANTEKKQREENELMQLQRSIVYGDGDKSSAKHQDAAEQIIRAAGFDPANPNSINPEFYKVAYNVPPTSLLNGWTSLTSGIPTKGADTLIKHYAAMSKRMLPDGRFHNTLGFNSGGAVSEKNLAMLEDILEVYQNTGEDPNTIIADIMSVRNDPKTKAAIKQELGDKTVRQHLIDRLDVSLAQDFDTTANVMLANGRSLSAVDKKIDDIIEVNYAEADMVVDFRSRENKDNLSRFALDVVYNSDEKAEFVRIIDETLEPHGYRLSPPISDETGLIAVAISGFVGEAKQAVLVPNPNAGAGSYFVYEEKGDGSIEPIFINVRDDVIMPMFDGSSLKEFRRRADDLKAQNLQAYRENVARNQETPDIVGN